MNDPLPAELKFKENTAYKSCLASGVLGREARPTTFLERMYCMKFLGYS